MLAIPDEMVKVLEKERKERLLEKECKERKFESIHEVIRIILSDHFRNK